jgi:DNA-binding transcriptional LysR family regulator
MLRLADFGKERQFFKRALQIWNSRAMAEDTRFDLDALLVFGKVVECRSLSKAAALLNIPKSTVSRKLSRLEADLGVKLLRKSTHQVSVTELGEQVYGHSLKILAEANDVRALVEGARQDPQGVLRVAIPGFVGVDFASRAGALFLKRYPKSRLEIRLVDSVDQSIRSGFDVVFEVGPLQDSALIARKVYTLELFLGASAEFLNGLAEPLAAPKQLNKLPFVDSGFYSGSHKLVLSRGARRHELAPFVRARSNSFQISKAYILNGVGVGALPKQMLDSEEVLDGRIAPVFPDWRLESVDVYMIYPFQLSFSNLISAFYETALEAISQRPPRRPPAGADLADVAPARALP